LALTYWDLVAEVGDFLGVTTSPTDADMLLVMRLIESGYRQYLFPPVLPNEKVAHKWSFMAPTTTLALTAADYDYDLPSTFGGLVGSFSYAADITSLQIQLVPEPMIRELRAASSQSGDPYMVAIRPKTYARETGTRYEAIFYPTPSTARTLTYRFAVLLEKLGKPRVSGSCTIGASSTLTDASGSFTTNGVIAGDKGILYTTASSTPGTYTVLTKDSATQLTLTTDPGAGTGSYMVLPANIYPLGGTEFSELLLEACLQVAEQRRDDTAGIHSGRMAGMLTAAVTRDRDKAPDTVGYNGDNSDGAGFDRHNLHEGSYKWNGTLLGP
jgi:hypothetical protein